jgi:hypothetical protein
VKRFINVSRNACYVRGVQDVNDGLVGELAQALVLGELLRLVRARFGSYELVDHWQQGEFHHDVVIRVREDRRERILVVATNCNGGVKEVLSFEKVPDRLALWHARCPENPEFTGHLPSLLGRAATEHWFDPCELLAPNARSEYQPAFRVRQCGGGWMLKPPA